MDLVRALTGGVYLGDRVLVWGVADARWELGVRSPTPYIRYGCPYSHTHTHTHKIKIKIKIKGCSTGDPAYPENRKVIKTSHSRG